MTSSYYFVSINGLPTFHDSTLREELFEGKVIITILYIMVKYVVMVITLSLFYT